MNKVSNVKKVVSFKEYYFNIEEAKQVILDDTVNKSFPETLFNNTMPHTPFRHESELPKDLKFYLKLADDKKTILKSYCYVETEKGQQFYSNSFRTWTPKGTKTKRNYFKKKFEGLK